MTKQAIKKLDEQEVKILERAAEIMPVYRRDLTPVPDSYPLETGCFKCNHVQGALDPNTRYTTLFMQPTKGGVSNAYYTFLVAPADRFWQGKTTLIRQLFNRPHSIHEPFVAYSSIDDPNLDTNIYVRLMWGTTMSNIKHKNQTINLKELVGAVPANTQFTFGAYNMPSIKGVYLNPRRLLIDPISRIEHFKAPTQNKLDTWAEKFYSGNSMSKMTAKISHNLQRVEPAQVLKKPAVKKKPSYESMTAQANNMPDLNAVLNQAPVIVSNPSATFPDYSWELNPEPNDF